MIYLFLGKSNRNDSFWMVPWVTVHKAIVKKKGKRTKKCVHNKRLLNIYVNARTEKDKSHLLMVS